MKTAFLFPGQGSQYVGMGKELYDAFQEAKEVFEEVDEALKQNLSKIIFEGPSEDLTMTSNTQPAIMAVSVAIIKVLEKQHNINLAKQISASAGHSLGEYSALTAAKSFELADTARLLRIRGNAMQKSVPIGKGAMAALLGADILKAEKLVKEAEKFGVCGVANDNGAEQIVLSGEIQAIEFVLANYKDFEIKKAIKLPVSAPFHSSLMKDAATAMKEALANVNINLPVYPVIANTSVSSYNSTQEIQHSLEEQVCARVRWRETMQIFDSEFNITRFVEVGPGKVLSTIANKIFPNGEAFSISSPHDLDKLVL